MGSGILSSLVDINDTVYVALPSRGEAQVWFNGDVFVDDVAANDYVDR